MEETSESSDIVNVYSQLVCSSFNADGSCACIGTKNSFSVYNTNPAAKRFETSKLGGLRIVELHYSSSLIACVPSGDVPGISPRKLILFDCIHNSKLTELAFPSTVIHCQMNTDILAISLDEEIFIYDIWSLTLVKKLSCERGGMMSLCTGAKSLLAVPQQHGIISMYSCTKDAVKSLCDNIQAHKNKITQCQISSSGQYLATSSATGTIIRIFSLPSGHLYGSFRRGFHHADVSSISFCPRDEYVAVGSSSGTVHIFTMKSFASSSSTAADSMKWGDMKSSQQSVSTTASATTPSHVRLFQSALGSISSIATEVVRHSKEFREAIDPVRAEYIIRIPGGEAKFKAIIAQDTTTTNSAPTQDFMQDPTKLYIITDGGFLYRFRIPVELNSANSQDSSNSDVILCIQEEEHNLLDM